MKQISLLTLMVLFINVSSFFCEKEETFIDNLKTEKEVEDLIKTFDKIRYDDFKVFDIADLANKESNFDSFCQIKVDSLMVNKSFYKADFDRNGLTDILVIGNFKYSYIGVVMDFGEDTLKLFQLASPKCMVPEILENENVTLINCYYLKRSWSTGKNVLFKKPLIYKFDDFIEFNSHIRQYNIEKIEYQTSQCFGECPMFSVDIDSTKEATFYAQMSNKESKTGKTISGLFKTKIKNENYTQLLELLNYLDFPSLKNKYSVNYTCAQSCTLTVTYNNGIVKEINDYGLNGTYGLDRFYQLMFELRFNQEWKKHKNR